MPRSRVSIGQNGREEAMGTVEATGPWDVVVVGSGAAGMTAALRARHAGLRVLLVEKSPFVGGTTAVSGGGAWIPASPPAVAAGIADSIGAARDYALAVIGADARRPLIDAYLENGPEMVAWLAAHSEVAFLLAPESSDWYPEIAGATRFGRLLAPREYDGRRLGRHFALLRPARTEFNAPGGLMIDLFDLPYLAAMPSPRSLLHMGRLAARFAVDRLRGYARGTRLTMGNALAGRLLASALKAGVEIRTGVGVKDLVLADGAVSGVLLDSGETVAAAKGVVLASGGFSGNAQLRQAYLPYADQHRSIVVEENVGDGMNMGLEAGGSLDGDNLLNAVWAVVSTMTRPDGSVARYAHLIDMSKPGCIAVDKAGARVGNEASIAFVEAMHARGAVPAYLIADKAFIGKYGLGMVFPGGPNLSKLKQAGYVVEGASLVELAGKLGIDADGLEASVATMNAYAATGEDLDFGKGTTIVDREIGDPRHGPNPCLGPIGKAPFYAVTIYPGDGSTTVGLRIDAQTRVLDAGGQPVRGLYAAGLDANSIWRGKSPAHGCGIGPALVQGYIAGKALAAGG
jgi:succinate dehydrogenase/fumarate reductase flavoprotein subunit